MDKTLGPARVPILKIDVINNVGQGQRQAGVPPGLPFQGSVYPAVKIFIRWRGVPHCERRGRVLAF